jgi:ABC-type phosphate/phosphonate transport system substrate-binding protein
MYSFGDVAAANEELWSILGDVLQRRGVDVSQISFDASRKAVPDEIGSEIFFTQVCGYPLMKRFRQQARIVGVPCYKWDGCVGSTHRAFFVVRKDDCATSLASMRGRIFGINSRLSNSGMNRPRLKLAERGGDGPFFSNVVLTGGHQASLERLVEGAIDMCSVDCVIWGLLAERAPHLTRECRIIDDSVASPCLPFVTSVSTSDAEVECLVDALHDVFRDPMTQSVRDVIGLTGLVVPDLTAYERLLAYESEAARLGYPELE